MSLDVRANSAFRRYREALAFYAAKENWQSRSEGFAAQYDPLPSPVEADRGERARAVLALARRGSSHDSK